MEANYIIKLQDSFTSPLGRMEGNMNRFESKVQHTQGVVSQFGNAFAGAFAGSLIAGGIQGAISMIKDLGVEVINVAREFGNMKSAIEFASGKDAATNIQFLDDEINRLGLDMQSTYTGFKTFQGALMGTSLEGEKGRYIFESVSEAASVMKLSAEQTEGSFLALGQMISKGTVSAEELRGQLGERLPGAFQIFARSLGVSTAKLGDMLKKGEVMAETALPKFAAELKKTFSPGVAKSQNDFNANMNRFNNFILESKISLGNSLIPALNEIVQIIPKIDFSPIIDNIKLVASGFSDAFGSFSDLIGLFGGSFSTLDTINGYFEYIGFVFRTLWTPLRFATTIFKTLFDLIRDAIPTFSALGDVVAAVFSGDWDRMSKGWGNVKEGADKMGSHFGGNWSKFAAGESKSWNDFFGSDSKDKDKNSSFSKSQGMGPMGAGAGGKKGKEAGVEKIASGTRNITINVGKLIGEMKFESLNGQSVAQVQDLIKRTLLTALNDTQIQPQ